VNVTPLPELPLSASAAHRALVVACTVYFVLAQVFVGTLPVWHEEIATHAMVPGTSYVRTRAGIDEVAVCPPGTVFQFQDARPTLVLCAGGLAWPVLISSYSGGVAYWPLQLLRPFHVGDPLASRRVGVALGLVALLALFGLISRVGGTMRAAVAVLVASVLPGVVVVHSLLVLFEVGPSVLLLIAAWVIAARKDREAPLSGRRALTAGALVGLAIFGNIKALVVFVPVAALALRTSKPLRQTSARAWALGLCGLALCAAPLFVSAVLDPARGFENQLWGRLAVSSRHLELGHLAAETWNAVISAGDFLFYFALLSGEDGALQPFSLLVSALAMSHSAYALVQALRGRSHDVVAAACGGLQLTYILFVWLTYETPAANYAPIAYAHAGSVACAIVFAGRLMKSRGFDARVGVGLAGGLTAVSLLWNDGRRGSPADFVDISVNVQAQRALAEHLERTGSKDVVTTSYNLALVPTAFTGAPTARLDVALGACRFVADPPECEVDVVLKVLRARPGARFVVPVEAGLIDEPSSRRIRETLALAARRAEGSVETEAVFKEPGGKPVLAIVGVGGMAAEPPLAPPHAVGPPVGSAPQVVVAGLTVGTSLTDGGVVRSTTRHEDVIRVAVAAEEGTYLLELVAPGALPFLPPARGGGYDIFYVPPLDDPNGRLLREVRAQDFATEIAHLLEQASRPKSSR
jgi:hypothetical protein